MSIHDWVLIDQFDSQVARPTTAWGFATGFVDLLSAMTEKATFGMPALETYIDNNREMIVNLATANTEAADLVSRYIEAAKNTINAKTK